IRNISCVRCSTLSSDFLPIAVHLPPIPHVSLYIVSGEIGAIHYAYLALQQHELISLSLAAVRARRYCSLSPGKRRLCSASLSDWLLPTHG
ncbi:MAG: hypothetical protein ACREXS_14480, partial [Gammaproteobacteria bacterium]